MLRSQVEAAAPPAKYAPQAVRALGLLAALAVLLAVTVASLGLGSRPLGVGEVWAGLTDAASATYTVVHDMRLPRTLLGLLVGVALGLAGAVAQALTRNPIADPGLLGINAGASAAVVSAITFLGVTSFTGYIWAAFAGAAVVSALVYVVSGSRSATPVRLALAGAAVNAALYSFVSGAQLLSAASLDRMRFWTVGSLADARMATVWRVLPFIAVGVALSLFLARGLNALALGDDTARALGARPAPTRVVAMIAVTLLCGAATAACGPIVFVGLMVPHMVRSVTGPDLRWMLPYCVVLSPVMLLGADIIGRVVARPGEILVGVVTAVVGGPLFLFLLLRRKAVAA
ncbi:iron chelate uptake ABC transporter family permease subunit [Phytomonospora sp. NPDC050363]|uniref:FecCD family ABC transporter permease n=1 Tax=Phytomonospora sp. NPDC050363 TaxID=3155642 RepID=UPI0033DAA4EA